MAAFHKYALAAAATDQLPYAGGLAHIDTCLRIAEVISRLCRVRINARCCASSFQETKAKHQPLAVVFKYDELARTQVNRRSGCVCPNR